MAVFESHNWDLNVLAGQTLYQQWNVFQDDAFLIPYDLTGYTFSVVLKLPSLSGSPAITLSPGSGLTLVSNPGSITIQQATSGWPVGRGRWYLQATDPAGEISYPLRGLLFVGNP